MKSQNRFSLFAFVTILVLVLSLLNTAIAFADDGTPPPAPTGEPVSPPAEETAPAATQEPVEEDSSTPEEPALPPVAVETEKPALLPTEEPAEEVDPPQEDVTVAEVLQDVPEGTEIVIVDEDGNFEPLATQDAAQIIVSGDPMWCPTGSLPGDAGCTAPFALFDDGIGGGLLPFLQTNSGLYAGAGTIYVAHDYSSAGEGGSIVIDSADGYGLTDLTIQGGWDFAGNTLAVASTFNRDLQINWNNNITLNDLIFGNTGASSNVYVDTTGGILLDNVESSNNSGGSGAYLYTYNGVGNITVQDSRFHDNNGVGLEAGSGGALTLANVFANINDGDGAELYAEEDVTITGGTFNGNDGDGIDAYSDDGDISIDLVDAQDNDDNGLSLGADDGGLTVSNGGFNSNGDDGIEGYADGDINLSNVIASGNEETGAALASYDGSVTVQDSAFNHSWDDFGLYIEYADSGATLTNVTSVWNYDTNLFIENAYGDIEITDGVFNHSQDGYGMDLYTDGDLHLANVQAGGNDEGGLYADIDGDFTVDGGLFNNNDGDGIYFEGSDADVSLTDVEAAGNEGSGIYLDYSGDVTIASSLFSYNEGSGLEIYSEGDVDLDGVTVNGNLMGDGAYIDNSYGSGPVTVSGSQFSSNHGGNGLTIYSGGTVTLETLTANYNAASGVYVDNTYGGSDVSIEDSRFDVNAGDGFYIDTNGSLSLNDVSAGANGDYGGELYVDGTITDSGTNSFNYNFSDGTDCFDGVNNGIYDQNNAGTWTNCYGPDTNVWYLSGGVARSFDSITLALADIDSGLFLMDDGILHIDSALTPYLEDASIDGSDAELGQITQVAGGGRDSTLIAGYLEFDDFGSGFSLSGLALSEYFDALGTTGAGILTNVSVAGLNASGSGIDINYHDGSISLNGVDASGVENGAGLDLNNSTSSLPQPVTIQNSTFNGNQYDGLHLDANGPVTLTDVSVSFNWDGYGAYICNLCGADGQDIIIRNSVFSYNHSAPGLDVSSSGDLTLENVTADGNEYVGAYLVTDGTSGDVSISDSTFNHSTGDGLDVFNYGQGSVLLDNATASGNYYYGGYIENGFFGGGGTGSVTVSNSAFNYNFYGANLEVDNYRDGDIHLNNVTANNSSGSGIYLENEGVAGSITVLNSTFNYSQDSYGLEAYNLASGNIFASGVTGNGNTYSGAYLENAGSGAGDVSVLNSTFNNSVDGDGLSTYNTTDGDTVITNVTANANRWTGAYLGSDGMGSVTVDPSVFKYNGDEGLHVHANGDIILDQVTASFNGSEGAYLETGGNASICDSTFDMNLGYGLDASSVGGSLTLNNVAFGGNVSGDYDYGGTATINNGIDCIPSSGAGGGGGGGGGSSSSVIIPVTGGEKITCDGSAVSEAVTLPNGDLVILPCPINDFGVVNPTPQAGLPGPLEDGLEFISALTALVIRGDQPVDLLEEPMVVSFLIPEGMEDAGFAILFWDGSGWVEVDGQLSEDGLRFEATTDLTGTFVFVTK